MARADRLRVRSEAEIAEAVRRARREGRRLKPAGSGGSKSGVGGTADVELRLDLDGGNVSVDPGRRLVTAPASMTVGRLQSRLRSEGLAVPTVGEWKNATLGGSLATATHGGSAHHGIMATSARALRIVTGAGEVREISRGDPDFPHAAVSLGALGVLTSVTLECVDRFALRLETDVVPFEEYLDDPVGHESRSEFHASVWVPWAHRVVRFAAERTPPPERPVPREERFGKRTALATFLSRRLGLQAAVSDRFFRRTAVGDCADILSPLEVSPRLARFRVVANDARGRMAAELAVEADRAREALLRIDDLFRTHRSPPNNPVGLRMSAADDFPLSPCSGRETLWLDLFYDATEPFVAGLAAAARDLGARCHWGKALAVPPGAVGDSYPGWDGFRRARARLDPDGVFANVVTDAVGLSGSVSPGAAV